MIVSDYSLSNSIYIPSLTFVRFSLLLQNYVGAKAWHYNKGGVLHCLRTSIRDGNYAENGHNNNKGPQEPALVWKQGFPSVRFLYNKRNPVAI